MSEEVPEPPNSMWKTSNLKSEILLWLDDLQGRFRSPLDRPHVRSKARAYLTNRSEEEQRKHREGKDLYEYMTSHGWWKNPADEALAELYANGLIEGAVERREVSLTPEGVARAVQERRAQVGAIAARQSMRMAALAATQAAKQAAEQAAREVRQKDSQLRAASAKNGLLRWLYAEYHSGSVDCNTLGVLSTPYATHEGALLTESEVRRAATYLASKGLLEYQEGDGQDPPKVRITPTGEDCVDIYGGDVSKYAKENPTSGGTHIGHRIYATNSDGGISTGAIVIGAGDRVYVISDVKGNVNLNSDQQVTRGYEDLARAVVDTMNRLHAIGLTSAEVQDAADTANEILIEVRQTEPDPSRVRRAVAALKGLLAPVATGLAIGAGAGAQEWARLAIEELGQAL